MTSLIRRPFKYSYIGVVYWVIGINILVFLLMMWAGNNVIGQMEITAAQLGMPDRDRTFILQLTISDLFSMRPLTVMNGWIWTFITYMFMHGNIGHILFNMLALFIFGIQVERQMGSKEFLLYYFVTGALAGIFSFFAYYLTGSPQIALVGASGAIFAVQLAYAVFFPTSIIYIWGILPLRAPILVLGFVALELMFIFTGGRGNTAHITHLAGFLFGWIYFLARYGISPWKQLARRY